MVALNVYRASNVRVETCNNSFLCCSCSLLCVSSSDWATENEAGRSVSVNGNEEPAGEMSPLQFSCKYSLITHNETPLYSTWRLFRMCVRSARLTVLTWVPRSVPPGTISKIRSSSGPCRIQQYRCGAFKFRVKQYKPAGTERVFSKTAVRTPNFSRLC